MRPTALSSFMQAAIVDAESSRWSVRTDEFSSAWSRAKVNCKNPPGRRFDKEANKVHKPAHGRYSYWLHDALRNLMERLMKRMLSIALLFAGAALLAGCPKKHNVNEPPVAGTQVPESAAAEGASTSTQPLGGDAANSARGLGKEGTGVLA